MNRSLPISQAAGGGSSSSTRGELLSFDMIAHHYGTWFGGYPWQLHCTGTYRNKMNLNMTEVSFRAFLDRLRRSIGGYPIAVVAVRERCTSGLGRPAISAHWHFLLATVPQRRAALESNAKRLWHEWNGWPRIEPYNPRLSATHYLSKMSSHSDFTVIMENLDRLCYLGPRDLYEDNQTNPLRPESRKAHDTWHNLGPSISIG